MRKNAADALSRDGETPRDPLLVALLAAAVGAFALEWVDVYYHWDHDAGYFLVVSRMISDGLKPCIDFKDKYTPLMNLIDALPLWLGVPPFALIHGIALAWIAANCLAVYGMVATWTGERRLGAWLTILYVAFVMDNQGHHLTLEHGVTLFTCLALVALKRAERPRGYLLSGALLSAAALSKQVGAISALPFTALLWLKAPGLAGKDAPPKERGKAARQALRAWGMAALGGFLPVLAVAAWLRFDYSTVIDRCVKQFTQYGEESPRADWGFLQVELGRSPLTMALLSLALAFGGIAAYRRLRSRNRREAILPLSLMIALAVYMVPEAYRYYPHYALNAWPCVALLLSCPYAEKRWKRPSRSVAATLAVIALFYMNGWSQLARWNYFHRWYKERDVVYGLYKPIADEVKRLAPADSRILVIGDEPVLYFLTGMDAEGGLQRFVVPIQDFHGASEVQLVVDHGQNGIEEKEKELLGKGYVIDLSVGPVDGETIRVWKRQHG